MSLMLVDRQLAGPVASLLAVVVAAVRGSVARVSAVSVGGFEIERMSKRGKRALGAEGSESQLTGRIRIRRMSLGSMSRS